MPDDGADRGMRGIRRAFAVLLAGAALLGVVVAPAAASGPASEPASARFEVRFMTNMIDHHAMAIEMAALCPGRVSHEPLLDGCASIVAAQSAEIAEMQVWLGQWYGVSYSPMMMPGDQRMLERLAATSTSAFEVAFMESMIGHHWKAVVRASACLQLAEHPDLVGTCQTIVASQTAEIATLQAWLCDWYDRCHYRAGLVRA